MVNAHEQAMLCPYNCGPHQIKEGLDGSWSCPRCCRPAPLWIVAHAAYERGVAEGAVRCASLQEEAVKQRLAAQNARAEVKQLRAELSELRGLQDGADRERLESDIVTVRDALEGAEDAGCLASTRAAAKALSRIAAALGIGERTAATETDMAGLDPHTT